MDYFIAVEVGNTLWLCLTDDNRMVALPYSTASKVFIRSTPEESKELIMRLKPKFIKALKPWVMAPFLLPHSLGSIRIFGVEQRVINIDRNILNFTHIDLVRDMRNTLDCM